MAGLFDFDPRTQDRWSLSGSIGDWWNEISGVKQQQEFNSAEAAKQRRWEEYMSDTAIQRQTADAQAAGVNPIFAVGNGGAAVPSGAAASSASSASGGPLSALSGVVGRVLALGVGSKMMHSAQAASSAAGAAASVMSDMNKVSSAVRAFSNGDFDDRVSSIIASLEHKGSVLKK